MKSGCHHPPQYDEVLPLRAKTLSNGKVVIVSCSSRHLDPSVLFFFPMVFTTSLKDIDSLRGVKRNYHGSRGPASSRTPLEHRVANKAMKVDVPRKGCELPRLKNGWWKYLDWFEDMWRRPWFPSKTIGFSVHSPFNQYGLKILFTMFVLS